MSSQPLLEAILPVLILAIPGFGQPAPNYLHESTACAENGRPKRIFSEVALSQDETWRAYVEVEVQGGPECLHTTRLWVARAQSKYQLVYLIPPKRTASGNGMEILGWAPASRMLLVKTKAWQQGSDAPLKEQVTAVDARTGVVYEPELGAMLDARWDRQCAFRIVDAGFSGDGSVNILVRAEFHTATDVDEQEEDVAPEKRCGHGEETWSFNFATGEIRQVGNAQVLQIFRKSGKTEPRLRRH